jgi:hemolysin III
MARDEARVQSVGEEIANAVSHAVGAVAILAATPVLVAAALSRHDALAAASVSVYCATVALLYLASTLYHALRPGRAKRVCRALDHSAIFLLIAGTYTPFALGVLRGPWGWGLLASVWTLAAVGIAIDGSPWRHARKASIALYVAMGWQALLAIGPIVERVAPAGIGLLVAGGLCYTVGIGFYALKRVRYTHLVWHLWVLIGSALHFVAVARYAA